MTNNSQRCWISYKLRPFAPSVAVACYCVLLGVVAQGFRQQCLECARSFNDKPYKDVAKENNIT